MDEPIPSPFMSLPSKFTDELGALCEKHGYDHWLVVVAGAENEHETRFEASTNCFSEGMVEYLGIVAEEISENLEQSSPDDK
jgi:hypothetical protein